MITSFANLGLEVLDVTFDHLHILQSCVATSIIC
jgi:hypothetical protein